MSKDYENKRQVLQPGNRKLDKSIYCFSIPPIMTCLNYKKCFKTCYAVNIYDAYKEAKKSWDSNFILTKDSRKFINRILAEIKKRNPTVIRIHVSGDFYSQKYINSWFIIAKASPSVKFYGFSKCFKNFKCSKIK